MNEIVSQPYRSLVDFPGVYRLLLETYSVDWRRGAPAPFFEYAQSLYWTDLSQTHRNAIWEEDGRIVAFAFYESKVGTAFFNVRDGFERLVPDMVDHAERRLRADDGGLELNLYLGQAAFLEEARRRGYVEVSRWTDGILDFAKVPLDRPLPEGFHFVPPGKFDMRRMIEASWRGFDHVTEPEGGVERGYHLIAAPHATPELDVVVEDRDGEYVCYAGMWWVPENRLAYMEPLCTVPEYRRMGLAAAALSECRRRTQPLGATHMTGGADPFYLAIGYDPLVTWTRWKRPDGPGTKA